MLKGPENFLKQNLNLGIKNMQDFTLIPKPLRKMRNYLAEKLRYNYYCFTKVLSRVVDPYSFFTDPDPDPDP
jgi:hypothetical protein